MILLVAATSAAAHLPDGDAKPRLVVVQDGPSFSIRPASRAAPDAAVPASVVPVRLGGNVTIDAALFAGAAARTNEVRHAACR
jgi:hypothetical protein